MKHFDALITTQKKTSSLQSPILEKIKKKLPKMTFFQNKFQKKNFKIFLFSKMTIFGNFFLIFKDMGPRRELGGFLRCNQCIKTLNFSYQTPPYDNFHFLGWNGFLQFVRPLVAGVKHKKKSKKNILSFLLAYKITRAGNISLILREM